MSQSSDPASETTYRGVRWRRENGGAVGFYDDSSGQWVRWAPGGDAPPLPPGWSILGVPTRVARPGWRSRWRMIPLVLVLFAVAAAVYQVVAPSGSNTAKEKAAAEALMGKCLAQHGTSGGHPRYSSNTVPCSSPQAAVKVVAVIPSTPGGPDCPAGTTGMELAYAGVTYPHVLCVQPVTPAGP